MNAKDQKLPYGISEYIKEHFREDFLLDVKAVKRLKSHVYYVIEVTKDNYIHTLKFDENGNLMKDDADQAFPEDSHEEPGFGDVPE
ncbi:MAG: hypothetical protein WEB30_04395 [Cyclobacteriaceae bacterium]